MALKTNKSPQKTIFGAQIERRNTWASTGTYLEWRPRWINSFDGFIWRTVRANTVQVGAKNRVVLLLDVLR